MAEVRFSLRGLVQLFMAPRTCGTTGRWYHDSNPIKGMDWKNYGSNTDNNEKVLSLSPLGLAWYDVVLRFTPVLGEIVDGLINMNHYNNTY